MDQLISNELLIFGAILALLLLGGLVSLAVGRKRPGLDELARRFELRRDEPDEGEEGFVMIGELEGRPLRLRSYPTRSGELLLWKTAWEVELVGPCELSLRVTRRPELPEGAPPLETGDPLFDEAFALWVEPPGALERLDEELRARALSLQALSEIDLRGRSLRVITAREPSLRDLVALRELAAELMHLA